MQVAGRQVDVGRRARSDRLGACSPRRACDPILAPRGSTSGAGAAPEPAGSGRCSGCALCSALTHCCSDARRRARGPSRGRNPEPAKGPDRERGRTAGQRCLRASRLDRPLSRSPWPRRRPAPTGVDAGVLAQGPADRLADEELPPEARPLEVGVDDVGQQVEVGLLAVLELREDGGAPHPEVVVDGIRPHDAASRSPCAATGSARPGRQPPAST